MSLRDDKQQNLQLELDFSSALTGAARDVAGEETESSTATSGPESPARTNRYAWYVGCLPEKIAQFDPPLFDGSHGRAQIGEFDLEGEMLRDDLIPSIARRGPGEFSPRDPGRSCPIRLPSRTPRVALAPS